MNISIILIVFSSIAVTSCVFLASYFFFVKTKNKLKDYTLGFLFIAITFRIAKSIFYYALPEISALGVALGFFGFALIGPLALNYYAINRYDLKQLSSIQLLHLIFPIIGFIIIISNKDLAYNFYLLTNIGLFAYLGFIAKKFIFNSNKLTNWYKALFYSLFTLAIIFIYQLLGKTINSYAIGIGLATIVVYFLFFFALKYPVVQKKKSKKVLSKVLLEKIKFAIEKDKIYIQPAITLAQFSEAIDSPTYLVSKATKSIYNKSFPEVINSFRIKEITQKLKQPEFINEKIEHLAYDVGFNTSSTFYNAFKKETSMSPREYQTKFLLSQ